MSKKTNIVFIKIVNNRTEIHQAETDLNIIRDCFQFCTPGIRKRVRRWLDGAERGRCRRLTVPFRGERVRRVRLEVR